MPEYTPEQRAAFSFAAIERGDRGAWRKIDRRRLSFTETEWSPLNQLYGSLAEGLRRLLIIPGDTAALGFAALNPADARRLRNQWVVFLTQ
jgi:hypothetical protein